ncbi:hypothetical protein O7606_21105 [Micromonospora sp. WMMD882]|uniref:hypothetical protein n=1 Tax=Micromonospora sp. WMMD882 TaxID=3015151 RepID=UPI00248B27DB|nr:hypothetical protein [Micromonospora sp. WMMD882]WBB78688.1 hypothetical protein O7606_21105 [Micromonospora sp. WMMD882]
MGEEPTHDPFSFLGHPLPPTFDLLRVELAPGCLTTVDEAAWRAAIVIVEQGEIEAEYPDGGRLGFRSGDLLWFDGNPPLVLRNNGVEPVRLAAISRRKAA